MNPSLRLAIIIALFIYFASIIYLMRKKRLTLKYTLLWLISGVIMILIAAFPVGFERLMSAIGVVYMYNGLFAVLIFALMIILISITSIVSKQNDDIRKLIQKCAMYEKRIRELEEKAEKQ